MGKIENKKFTLITIYYDTLHMGWHHVNNHISNSDQLRAYRQEMHELPTLRAMTLKGIIT